MKRCRIISELPEEVKSKNSALKPINKLEVDLQEILFIHFIRPSSGTQWRGGIIPACFIFHKLVYLTWMDEYVVNWFLSYCVIVLRLTNLHSVTR